eukprot:GHVU01191212.1.p4 GENE.GHVU01191212.1~~GHVU01191212.1.p4  ORF type:complete len:164 (+),score=17.31 GHVU01191212.1:4668-5159(+)
MQVYRDVFLAAMLSVLCCGIRDNLEMHSLLNGCASAYHLLPALWVDIRDRVDIRASESADNGGRSTPSSSSSWTPSASASLLVFTSMVMECEPVWYDDMEVSCMRILYALEKAVETPRKPVNAMSIWLLLKKVRSLGGRCRPSTRNKSTLLATSVFNARLKWA